MRESDPNFLHHTRRRFLQWAGSVGVAGAAGCSGRGSTETPAEEPTPITTPTGTSSPTATPSQEPTEQTETAKTAPTSFDDKWWPMYLYDRFNSQYNDATTGPTNPVEAAWRFETDGKVRSSPAVVDGTVYIGSTDGHLYALDMVTGEPEWTFETDGPVVSSPAVLHQTVYVGSNDHHLYALNRTTGNPRWQFQTGGEVLSSPNVADPSWRDQGLVLIGSNDGNVYYLQARTGENYHTAGYDGPVVSKPYIADWKQDGKPNMWMHAGSTDPNGLHYGNYVTNRENESYGHIKPNRFLRYEAGAPIYASFTARHDYLITDTTYFGTDHGSVRTLKIGDGFKGTNWEFQTDGKIRSSPAITRSPVIVYAGSWDGKMYAIDGPTGELHWQFETGGQVESSPAIADGALYVGSGDNHVYAIDIESGDDMWRFSTDGAVYSSPAVVAGTVFVGSDDGSVYALTP